jgi:hypothetical protein
MNIRRMAQAASIAGVAIFVMAATASAAIITFNTQAVPGTGFGVGGAGGLSLDSSSGAPATLVFQPQPNTTYGVPSNVNFGIFTLECVTCTTQPPSGTAGSAQFDAFTFNIVLTDVTDGATGQFVGTSSGGNVWHNASDITLNWLPLQLGPGTSGALTGSFGQTTFETTVRTRIVAPNSGLDVGQTTVQGSLDSASAVPEPATFTLVGGALLGLGMLCRKRLPRQ